MPIFILKFNPESQMLQTKVIRYKKNKYLTFFFKNKTRHENANKQLTPFLLESSSKPNSGRHKLNCNLDHRTFKKCLFTWPAAINNRPSGCL